MWLIVLSVCFVSISSACEFQPSSSLETGIVCRVTKPAALVLNEKTTDVIRAAFGHATFPNITGEKGVRFLGAVTYGLTNIQVSNLAIENSEVELKEDDAVEIRIKNVSASFKGTLNYGYGSWFVNVQQNVDFEIYSSIDLQVYTRLTCGKSRIASDTSECYLSFHKLVLHLHGNKDPGWFKQLFTDFISLTLKLVLKGQICKEINNVSDILANFIQDTAKDFLGFKDIGVNIDITSFPIIKANYMETHHKGFLEYKNISVYYNSSIYSPCLLTEDRMLYFWFSEQILDYLVLGYYLDEQLVLTLTRTEFHDILKEDKTESHQQIINEILHDLPMNNPMVKVWSRGRPEIKISLKGTIVRASVAVQVEASATANLYFEAETLTTVQTSYADKELTLHPSDSIVHITDLRNALPICQNEDSLRLFLQKMVTDFGIPAVAKHTSPPGSMLPTLRPSRGAYQWPSTSPFRLRSRILSLTQEAGLGPVLTSLLNHKGLNLFEIINPEIIPHEGYLIVQTDFGFPHHLLVNFLQRVLH